MVIPIQCAAHIKSISNRVGMSYVWSKQEVTYVDSFINEANQSIKEIFIQNNALTTARSSECHLYKHIVTTFCIQNYLIDCLPVNIRHDVLHKAV